MKRHIQKVLSALLSFTILCSLGQTAFAISFTDVSSSAWYAQAVGYVSENGLMSGTGGGKFSPGTPMTRAMLATVLHRMDNSPAPSSSHGFSDVPQGAYYEQAVAWAARNGIKGTAARPGFQHGICGRFAKEHRRISRLQHDRRG